MKRLAGRRPSPAAIVASIALFVGVGGVAFAAIPDSEGVIHACYQNETGNLRVVESDTDCRPFETVLDWNQEGPVGPEEDRRAQPGRKVKQAAAMLSTAVRRTLPSLGASSRPTRL